MTHLKHPGGLQEDFKLIIGYVGARSYSKPDSGQIS